ncbi:tRNA (guanosine(37)-N1)-methyltransferase TrmD [Candidatus Berkelbacteria bacterium]|nr:tRNA (guanosine(37)-N1)-methyltransferase TrmD [Candidatus Berkelbacteria bacterium]
MKITIITLFPEAFKGFLKTSIIKRAQTKKKVKIDPVNLRDFGIGKHKQVDDRPYGGGAGMVMRVDVVDSAIKAVKTKILKLKSKNDKLKLKTILLTPQGKLFNQKIAKKLSKYENIILICGHYEGFDERIRKLADEEISIGDYVLTGGEVPAMVVIDAITRLIPGVLGKDESSLEESFSSSSKSYGLRPLLEYPHYTRPEEYKGKKVPKILLSGHHQKIKEWREKESIKKTQKRRPEFLS